MNIIGKWLSDDGVELIIRSITKNTINGILRSKGKFLLDEKKFNGVILKKDTDEVIFSFYLKIKVNTKNDFDYLISLGTINGEKRKISLTIAKFHFHHNQKIPVRIERFDLRHKG